MRIKELLAASFFVCLPAYATTYYVDGNCPTEGNGSSKTCAGSPSSTTNNPKNNIDDGIALLTAAGDILNIRGAHPAHDAETTDFDGRYYGDWFRVLDKHGSSGSPLTIQPDGYTTPGTGEVVFIDGSKSPAGGWTQCSDCSTGTCAGVAGTCSQTWWASGESGQTVHAIQAQKSDGSVTFKVSGPGELSNAHSGYVSGRCSGETWHVCYASSDCISGETCSASSNEVDSYSTDAILFVRWGTGADAPGGSNNPNPRVLYDNNGNGFVIDNSTYITIRGFTFRAHKNAGIAVTDEHGPVNNIVLTDNRVFYTTDRFGHGSDYGIAIYRAGSATVSNSEIGWSGSETIHTAALSSGSVLTISGNRLHDPGDSNVLGPYTAGTPSGMILGDDNTGNGNYAGSVVENNLIERPRGYSLILENRSDGWIVRNNVFNTSIGRGCLKMDAADTVDSSEVNDSQIYNNLFQNCGQSPTDTSPGIYAVVSSGKSIQNNKIYNNTFVNNYSGALYLNGSGTVSGNEFKNNIFYDAGSVQQVTWGANDTFANNLAYSATLSGSSTLVSWNGTGYTCSGITTLDSASKCSNPVFVSSSDFHIQSGSPARDAGTSTGMPSGKTKDIDNELALNHGLPDYSDNQSASGAWDMGCDEYVSGGGGGSCGDGHCHK